MSTTAAIHSSSTAVHDIPLSSIRESKTNPRRQFDETKLAELAAKIRLHGVLQPILVRPLPDGEAEGFELVAGARRYRASKLAERETIPASIRELTDTQCLELQLIELSSVRKKCSTTYATVISERCGIVIYSEFYNVNQFALVTWSVAERRQGELRADFWRMHDQSSKDYRA